MAGTFMWAQDPIVKAIEKSNGKIPALAWRLSNACVYWMVHLALLAIFFIAIAVLFTPAVIEGGGIPFIVASAMAGLTVFVQMFAPFLGCAFMALAMLFVPLYWLTTLAAAVLMRKYVWAIGILLLWPLAPLFKYYEGARLKG